MIILPDKNIPTARFLPPVPKMQWREPSVAQPKDIFGNTTTQTRFRIRAKTHDGVALWTGWFDDREDFDAFLWAVFLGNISKEPALWDLPTPYWPNLDPGLLYDFTTVTFLTGSPGSDQTYTTPVDWNNTMNSVEVIGGGGGGGYYGTGGGAGAYAEAVNITISGSQTYRVASGGPGSSGSAGTTGGDGWFGGASLSASKAGAKGGTGGTNAVSGTNYVNGGQASACYGGVGGNTLNPGAPYAYSGGRGAPYENSTTYHGGGGGGAAGPNGAGADGTRPGVGGAAGNGSGGSGGAAGNSTSAPAAPAGGTEWDSTHGSGGGGGGGQGSPANGPGGNGGNYGGGGGGGGQYFASGLGGSGIQGIVVVTYTPASKLNPFMSFCFH